MPLSKSRHGSPTVTQGPRSIRKMARAIRSDYTKRRQENIFARSTARCGPTGRTTKLELLLHIILPGQPGDQKKEIVCEPDRAGSLGRPGGSRTQSHQVHFARPIGRPKREIHLRPRPGGLVRSTERICLFVVSYDSPSPDRVVFRDGFFRVFSRFFKKYKYVFSIFV